MSGPRTTLEGYWWVWRLDGESFGDYRFGMGGNRPRPDWVDAEVDADYRIDFPATYIAERFRRVSIDRHKQERLVRVYTSRTEYTTRDMRDVLAGDPHPLKEE